MRCAVQVATATEKTTYYPEKTDRIKNRNQNRNQNRKSKREERECIHQLCKMGVLLDLPGMTSTGAAAASKASTVSNSFIGDDTTLCCAALRRLEGPVPSMDMRGGGEKSQEQKKKTKTKTEATANKKQDRTKRKIENGP